MTNAQKALVVLFRDVANPVWLHWSNKSRDVGAAVVGVVSVNAVVAYFVMQAYWLGKRQDEAERLGKAE